MTSERLIGKNVRDTTLGGVITIDTNKETATVGILKIKSYTTAERDALTGEAGMLIYNSTTSKLNVYTSTWEVITSV